MAQETPSQAAAHSVAVRGADGLTAVVRRGLPPRHGLGALRNTNARGAFGRGFDLHQPVVHRRLDAETGRTGTHALREARRAAWPRSVGSRLPAQVTAK